MQCVAKGSVAGWRAAGLMLLLSAGAVDQPTARADSRANADSERAASTPEPETVRDARIATEEAVQRIAALAAVAAGVVRDLRQEATRSATERRRGGSAAKTNEVDTGHEP